MDKDKIIIDLVDLEYLVLMAYGYIDDELGGMESGTAHAMQVREIINKYDVKISII